MILDMFRTRDFAIILSAIVFLVVAISATWSHAVGFNVNGKQMAAVFQSTDEKEETFTGVIEEKAGPTYEERIASFKKRIASLGKTKVAIVAPEEVPVVPEVPVASAEVKENRCGSYHTLQTSWSPYGIAFEEVEGARLVYKESAVSPEASSTAVVNKRDILAQLPVRSVPSPSQSCIATDVVGIATDGSLIRNTEIGMYKIFGSETLIGYALDGFPIYGLSSIKTDICGGSMASGQYRYQLTSDRDVMINCFAGSPISL
jgi:hypothetical protein